MLILGCFIGISGVLSAISFAKDFLTFTLMFSISFGICNGLTYTIPLKICWDYYPNNRGMVSGMIICGFGLGSFIFSLVSTLLVNPENVQADIIIHVSESCSLTLYGEEVSKNVPRMMYSLIATWVVLCCVAV